MTPGRQASWLEIRRQALSPASFFQLLEHLGANDAIVVAWCYEGDAMPSLAWGCVFIKATVDQSDSGHVKVSYWQLVVFGMTHFVYLWVPGIERQVRIILVYYHDIYSRRRRRRRRRRKARQFARVISGRTLPAKVFAHCQSLMPSKKFKPSTIKVWDLQL